MPYVNKPRPYKHEYQLQIQRGEIPDKLERQRARRALDKKGGHAAPFYRLAAEAAAAGTPEAPEAAATGSAPPGGTQGTALTGASPRSF